MLYGWQLSWCAVVERHVSEVDAAWSCQHLRFSLLLLWCLLHLHESLCGGEDTDEGGHQARQLTGRALYAVYQLQECGHCSEGDGALTEAQCSPEECDEIAQREANVEEEIAGHAEGCAAAHPPAQVALYGL